MPYRLFLYVCRQNAETPENGASVPEGGIGRGQKKGKPPVFLRRIQCMFT